MANITEVSQWENVIRQLENGEAATGGADGLANIQAKQLANRTKWLKSKSIGANGGHLENSYIYRTVDDGYLRLNGSTGDNNGASLTLSGKDYKTEENKNGLFYLTAHTESLACTLLGFPNGKLTWDGNDLAGSAIVAKLIAQNGYVKYASGLIIQWGRFFTSTSPSGSLVTYPISFTAEPKVLAGVQNCVPSQKELGLEVRCFTEGLINGFKVYHSLPSSENWRMGYIAIGC